MLPEDPMRSGEAMPTTALAKIIPLRRTDAVKDGANHAPALSGQVSKRPVAVHQVMSKRRGSREDAVRHYLKFMLPGIPVTAFVISFLYGYLLIGMHTLVLNGHATEQSYTPGVDPTLPLIGALLVACATGMLCVAIYWGYLRIAEHHDP